MKNRRKKKDEKYNENSRVLNDFKGENNTARVFETRSIYFSYMEFDDCVDEGLKRPESNIIGDLILEQLFRESFSAKIIIIPTAERRRAAEKAF